MMHRARHAAWVLLLLVLYAGTWSVGNRVDVMNNVTARCRVRCLSQLKVGFNILTVLSILKVL